MHEKKYLNNRIKRNAIKSGKIIKINKVTEQKYWRISYYPKKLIYQEFWIANLRIVCKLINEISYMSENTVKQIE